MQPSRLTHAEEPSHAAAWVVHFGFAQAKQLSISTPTAELFWAVVALEDDPPTAAGGVAVVLVASQANIDAWDTPHNSMNPKPWCRLVCMFDLALSADAIPSLAT
ncbi:MAG TPA: hypothetical protein VIV60_08085 [Polyangiaceae bacterium]